MRRISKRTEYGLKAVIALGRHYGDGPVLIATLSSDETIPLKFLESILLDLKGRGMLESKKEKGGGYQTESSTFYDYDRVHHSLAGRAARTLALRQ
jgi:DNA-binding IscR family transcriptional regulator